MDLMIPFNSLNGDRVYSADDISDMFAAAITNGVHPSPSDSLAVFAAGGFSVAIRPGRCALNGRLGLNRATKTVSLDLPGSQNPRIDSVIMRLDLPGRRITEHVLKGTPAPNPVPAELTRTPLIHEICLAHIMVSPSAQYLSQSVITDTRHDTELCGIMTSLVEIDADGLFGQYQSIFEEWMEGSRSGAAEWMEANRLQFASWFEGLQSMLDDNAAAALASEIQLLKTSVSAIEETQAATAREVTRFTDTIPTGGWSFNARLNLWQADIQCAYVTGPRSDVHITLSPDSLLSPVMQAGTTLEGAFRVYASSQPDSTVEYTAIVTITGDGRN